jgi:beta-alanine degradation protein BauB
MAEELAPIATSLVFEDDYVRVWQQVVPAGGTIQKHAHQLDYFLLNVSGEGPFDITFHDGTGGRFGDHATFTPRPGTADYVRKGHVETAHNRGEEYRAVLVELKRR